MIHWRASNIFGHDDVVLVVLSEARRPHRRAAALGRWIHNFFLPQVHLFASATRTLATEVVGAIVDDYPIGHVALIFGDG